VTNGGSFAGQGGNSQDFATDNTYGSFDDHFGLEGGLLGNITTSLGSGGGLNGTAHDYTRGGGSIRLQAASF
jgi:hypothetical protein